MEKILRKLKSINLQDGQARLKNTPFSLLNRLENLLILKFQMIFAEAAENC